ncbi:MAG: carbon-nitrogen hydrolase family protein [Elusimicrobiota bacterium]
MGKIRVAAVQMDPRLGRVAENLDRILKGLAEARSRLVVFPECALTGYGFESRERALRFAEAVPGPSTNRLAAACRREDAWAVVGLLERRGDDLFNTAALVGPDGLVGWYRKMHLPLLGVDRFVKPGDLGFPVLKTPIGRVGLLICYDGSFPEAPRALKLGGAQLICLPTNWPMAAEVQCRHSPMMRAQENHVNFLSCNRVGEEAGFRFRGESKICDFDGRLLAEAGREEALITAEIDMAAADRNRVVNVPGEYELDRIAHRRPNHYGRLTEIP